MMAGLVSSMSRCHAEFPHRATHVVMRAVMLIASLVVAVTLTGCAAQMAFREGRGLIEEGKVEDGLVKLHEAVDRDPRNLEYRKTYLQARDQALESLLNQADRLAAAGRATDAKKLYQRVLAIDPNNDRARAGMDAMDAVPRHGKLLAEAQAAWEKKDAELAQLKLRTILAENPQHAAALALKRAITDKTTPLPPETALSAAYRKPITIEFRDAPLKQVLEVISRTSGLNFLFDKDVKTDQKTSIFLKNSTVASAVHFVLLTNQLEQQVLDGNTILIYPNTAAKLKDYQEMVVKTFYLANADAKTVSNTIKTILKTKDIVVDEKLNLVIVRDSPEAVRLAEKLVAVHDVAEPEVMLEVEILEVKRTRLLDLGIQWPDSLTLTPLPATSGGNLTLRDLRTNLNSGTIGAGISPVVLNAKKTDTDANILANPRIRARNHEKARILIGDRVPNITTTSNLTGFVSESVNYIDVGLKLDVEPTVYLDGEVAIKVGLEVSNIVSQLQTKSGSVAYQIGTRNANTVLRLKDGENQVLAGLINDEDRSTANKVPGLGELPVVGRLFGSRADDNQKTEIVLSITPHVIRNIQRPDAALSEFRSGTDSSFRSRPETISAAPGSASSAPTAPTANTSTAKTSAGPSATPNDPSHMTSANAGVNTGANIGSGTGSTFDNAAANAANTGTTATAGNANPLDTSINTNAGAATGRALLSLQGPTQLKVGDTATVQVMMQADQPIISVPMTIGFDSHVLQPVAVTEGTFLKQGGAQTNFTNQVDPSGKISIAAGRTGAGGATNAGVFAILSFRALAASDASQIQVLAAAPLGVGATPVPATVPQPFTLKVSQ
jgi:general secretion pathway protein D